MLGSAPPLRAASEARNGIQARDMPYPSSSSFVMFLPLLDYDVPSLLRAAQRWQRESALAEAFSDEHLRALGEYAAPREQQPQQASSDSAPLPPVLEDMEFMLESLSSSAGGASSSSTAPAADAADDSATQPPSSTANAEQSSTSSAFETGSSSSSSGGGGSGAGGGGAVVLSSTGGARCSPSSSSGAVGASGLSSSTSPATLLWFSSSSGAAASDARASSTGADDEGKFAVPRPDSSASSPTGAIAGAAAGGSVIALSLAAFALYRKRYYGTICPCGSGSGSGKFAERPGLPTLLPDPEKVRRLSAVEFRRIPVIEPHPDLIVRYRDGDPFYPIVIIGRE
jgi:hypothetical protein